MKYAVKLPAKNMIPEKVSFPDDARVLESFYKSCDCGSTFVKDFFRIVYQICFHHKSTRFTIGTHCSKEKIECFSKNGQ